jgi:hypothetical protein
MPPVTLPDDRDKTVQRDHGNNKFVMQGKTGKESASLISPRAVNMFASGRGARPLSASATIAPPPSPGDGASLTFYSNPLQNNLNPTASQPIPTSQPGSGDQVSISVFKDPVGLQELWQEWYGTTQSDIALSSAIAPSITGSGSTAIAGTYGVQDGTEGDSYLNWGSEGRINCLTLGNNNNWVNGDANTWVNGNVNVQINQDSTTQFGTSSSNVAVKTTVWGTNNTIIGGANATTVMGDNTNTVLGFNDTFNIGTNSTVNIGINTTLNLAGIDEISVFKIESIDSLKVVTSPVKIKSVLTSLRNSQAEVNLSDLDVDTNAAKIVDSGAVVIQ